MEMQHKILECIPNFSEGQNEMVLQKIADAIQSVSGVWLLHQDQSPAANRTVFTFAGAPELVILAAFEAIKIAAENIDMSQQKGVHPRIGATDVCPLVPLYGMTIEEANTYALQLAKRVGEELNIPVFLYEHSQAQGYRKMLPQIRKGQYEGLAEKMQLPEWQADFGPRVMNYKTGATVIGVRDILVAFNISLNTNDVNIATNIAQVMRSSSKSEHSLAKLRAIGWYMADYNQAQVSFNLLDFKKSTPLMVWQKCKALAQTFGVEIVGSEVIGLIPEQCLIEAGKYECLQKNIDVVDKDKLVLMAINLLGLNRLKPFNPEEKILERVLTKYTFLG